MMVGSVLYATVLSVGLDAPALALEVTKSADIPAAADKVWKTIGEFCGIGDGHPAVAKCALSETGGKPHRTMSLKSGGTIVEEQQARDDRTMSHTSTMLQSPLPVDDDKSTISVAPGGPGSKVTWTGPFKAEGAPDAKAEGVIGGVYDGGLKGIADKAK